MIPKGSIYTDLPLPSRFVQVVKKPGKPPTEPKPPEHVSAPNLGVSSDSINLPEIHVGGVLEPEPPKITRTDDYTIEELDLTDYDN